MLVKLICTLPSSDLLNTVRVKAAGHGYCRTCQAERLCRETLSYRRPASAVTSSRTFAVEASVRAAYGCRKDKNVVLSVRIIRCVQCNPVR